jgi:hypothetical protein
MFGHLGAARAQVFADTMFPNANPAGIWNVDLFDLL